MAPYCTLSPRVSPWYSGTFCIWSGLARIIAAHTPLGGLPGVYAVPKIAKPKTAGQIHQMKRPGIHPVGGTPGLRIQIKPSGAKSWLLRTTIGGRRREIGLGPFPSVSLADARAKADADLEAIREGRDPAAERRQARQALAAAQAATITFDEAARKYLAAKSHEFTNAKHSKQWAASLERYASPHIGAKPVHEITLNDVVQVLEPIWYTKTQTASAVRERVEKVLAWATTSGFRSGDNPARWRGHLDTLLPAPNKITQVQHHPALPVDDLGDFMAALREQDAIAARALEFLILTATRSGEVRGATWDEVDLDNAIWVIPAERMKNRREHRVPLSEDAIKVLRNVPRLQDCPYIFPSAVGGPQPDVNLSRLVKRIDSRTVPHGFRSTFSTWANERTAYPHEVIEQALAHTVGDAVVRAYARGTLYAKRAKLMADWAKFCSTIQAKAEVRHIGQARA